MKFLICWVFLLPSLFPVTGLHPVSPGQLVLQFQNRVGDTALQLYDRQYSTRQGEPFVVTRFRYYVSKIRCTDAAGVETLLSDRSYLVDEADPASLQIILKGPATHIRSLKFLLGVDSALNTSGVQEGDLDPARGMFWTWNSGYIFAKLEGKSDSSHAPAHLLTWDIGGFRGSSNAAREISLQVPAGDSRQLVIQADILQWFDGRRPIGIAQHPVCHQPGPLAMQIADNYSTMFQIRP